MNFRFYRRKKNLNIRFFRDLRKILDDSSQHPVRAMSTEWRPKGNWLDARFTDAIYNVVESLFGIQTHARDGMRMNSRGDGNFSLLFSSFVHPQPTRLPLRRYKLRYTCSLLGDIAESNKKNRIFNMDAAIAFVLDITIIAAPTEQLHILTSF